jgi:iron complex outermembrane recepter protein
MKSGGFLSATLLIAMLAATPVLGEETKTEKETNEGKEAKTESETKAAKEANLEEMVVTATRTEKSIADAPGSVSIVTKKEIQKRNIQSVDEALSLIPGVFDNRIKGLMGTTSTVTFRGLSGSGRTLLLLDGMPMNDGYSSSQQWGGLYTQDLHQIEVVRGPSSNLYGGSAMGGVINLMTTMPSKREFTLSSGYGDAWDDGEAMQNLWTTHLSYGDKIGNLRLYASLGYRATDGYPSNQVFTSSAPAGTTGAIPTTTNKGIPRFLIGDTGDNGWWDYTASIRAQYDISETANVRFSWLRAASKYYYGEPNTYLTSTTTGEPVFPASSVRSYLSGDGATTQDTYTLSAEALFGKVQGKLLLGINDQGENWYTTPVSPANLSGGPGTKSDSPNRTYYTDLQLSTPIMDKHLLTGGFSFKYDDAKSNNYDISNYEDPDSDSSAPTQWGKGVSKTYSGYLQAEIALHDTLTLYAGLRDDYWVSTDGEDGQTGATGFSNSYKHKSKNSLCPKGALVWRPLDGTTLRVSGGKAFRAPPLNQMYKTWVSSTSLTVYNSNPNLDPETVLSWDIGVEQKLWKGAKVKATFFENYLSDMIYNITTGTGTIPGDTRIYTLKRYTNVGGAETRGVELEAEQSFGKNLRLFINYTYTDANITEFDPDPDLEGKRMTQAPRHMLNAGIDASYGPASLFTTWRYVSKRFAQDDTSDCVSGVYGSYDPFMVWDMKASYNATKWATVSVSVNNLLDEKYYVYYVSPGRSWFANLDLKF